MAETEKRLEEIEALKSEKREGRCQYGSV